MQEFICYPWLNKMTNLFLVCVCTVKDINAMLFSQETKQNLLKFWKAGFFSRNRNCLLKIFCEAKISFFSFLILAFEYVRLVLPLWQNEISYPIKKKKKKRRREKKCNLKPPKHRGPFRDFFSSSKTDILLLLITLIAKTKTEGNWCLAMIVYFGAKQTKNICNLMMWPLLRIRPSCSKTSFAKSKLKISMSHKVSYMYKLNLLLRTWSLETLKLDHKTRLSKMSNDIVFPP